MKLSIDNKWIEIKKTDHFFTKLIGLIGKKNINYGLLFRCNGIHTFFMKERIDVILTDRDYKVLYIYKSLSKNRIILPKKNVYYTLELPNNSITNLNIDQYINLESK